MTGLPPYRPPEKVPAPTLHLAKMALPQPQPPTDPSARLPVNVKRVVIPAPLEGELPLVRAQLVVAGQGRRIPVIAPGPAGLDVPWASHPDLPALLLPGPAVEEVLWHNRWRVEHFISPSAVDLPFSAAAFVKAAWHAISQVHDRMSVIVELAQLLTEVDVGGYGSARERAYIRQMKLPMVVERRLEASIGHNRPLLDPRCLRWIISELCVAGSYTPKIPAVDLDDEARAVVRAWLPLLGISAIPFRKELYRAVWFLHEAFLLGSQKGDTLQSQHLEILAMSGANAVGARPFGDPDEQVLRAVEMWSLRDDDPFLAVRDVQPSAIRRDFQAAAGLTIREALGLALLETFALRAAHHGLPHQVRAARVLQMRLAEPHKRLAFVRTLKRELAMTPFKLGREVLREMDRYRLPYRGLGSVPPHASEAIRDHPVLDLPQGLLPVGRALFLSRVAELPEEIHRRRQGLSRRRTRGRVGHLFEARLQHRLHSLKSKRWVATEDQIDRVVPRTANRPDAIIGSPGHRYLMIEINSSRLETGVAAGNIDKVMELVDKYITKREQADELIRVARGVIGRLHGTRQAIVRSAVPLVVTDEPLPSNPALEREIGARRPGWNPRFVCSIDEFELLLDLVEAGWDAPALVEDWQRRGDGQMLGTFMRAQLDITPLDRDIPGRIAALCDPAA